MRNNGILTPTDIDNQILNFALPKDTSSQTTVLSLLKQAKTMAGNGTSIAPDFFGRFMDLKQNGAFDKQPSVGVLPKW